MKLEKDHVVPFSAAAIDLFEKLPLVDDGELLFPAPCGGELSDSAFGLLIDDMHDCNVKRGDIGYLDPTQNRVATQHGFRSTFRDWAAEVAVFPREIIEHALAHKLKDEAEAAYQRGTMLLKRALLMEDWATFCSQVVPQIPTVFKFPERTASPLHASSHGPHQRAGSNETGEQTAT